MSTITMQGVARLARVQRPVVSMWRKRTRGSGDPFPAPVVGDARNPIFDGEEVAAWLVRTGRGNNPDAVLDAGAHVAPAVGAATAASMAALLTLRELHGAPIGALSAAELHRLALEADPDDTMLQAEVAACADDLPALARHIDAAVDADYTVGAALSRLLGDASQVDRTRSLSEEALGLIAALTRSLIADVTESTGGVPALLVPAGGTIPMLHRVIGSVDAEVDIAARGSAADDDDDDDRMLRRLLALAGRPVDVAAFTTRESLQAPAVHLVQLPTLGDVDAVRTMTELDDIALSMTDDQRALVVGPASLLVDPLEGELDRVRSSILRLSRVRAIVRLPRGCAPAAPRAHLALWVLGASQGGLPVAERSVVTVDLDRIPLSGDVRHDVVLDLVSSLGGGYERHLRAFRFATPVMLRNLLAAERQLVLPKIRTERVDTAELVSRFLETRGRVAAFGSPLPQVAPADRAHDPLPTALLGDLVRERHIRRIPGTRLPDDVLTGDGTTGFRVITAAQVRGGSPEGRYVDRLRFAQLGSGARLTEAGDVVVIGGDRPGALLDELGASVVESPAAILRVDRTASAAVEPALLQHDIARFAAGDWRTWPVRRLAAGAHEALRESIDDVVDRIAALHKQIAQFKDYERALVDGFTAGVLAAGDHPRETTEGGH